MLLPETDAKNGFFRYLTYSEEDEKWQLVCTDAGHLEIGPYTTYPPYKKGHPGPFQSVAVGRTLSEYQIIYITKGQGSFETVGKSFAVGPGAIMMLFPGVAHVYKPEFEIGWTEYWVGFKGPFVDHLRREGFLSPDRPLFDVGLRNGLLAAFTEIFELVREQEPLYQIRASSLVLGLVADILARERKAVQYSHSEQLVQKAKFFMDENIYGEINLSGICEALGVSSSHLNEVFKAYTAMTPYQYFISIKMHKAKELLERGDSAIKEVAFRLGFKDEYYFSRLFKRKAGVSPSRWSEPSGPHRDQAAEDEDEIGERGGEHPPRP
jgi:AraC-like DNA-binding protein